MSKMSYYTKTIVTLLIPLLIPFLQSCSSDEEIDSNPMTPINLSEEEAEVSANLRPFSLNLLKSVTMCASADENVAVSPLGASIVAGMFGNAIDTKDRSELLSVLGISDLNPLNSYCKTMILALPLHDSSASLLMANGVWLNNANVTLSESYKLTLESNYKSEINIVNFNTPHILTSINEWVREKSNGKIPSILKNLDSGEYAIWINTLYFKALWKEKFDKQQTKPAPFYKENGEKVTVNMMMGSKASSGFRISEKIDPNKPTHKFPDDFYVTEGANFDFGNKAFTLTAAMPDDRFSTLSDFIESISPDYFSKMASAGGLEDVVFPKIRINVLTDLIKPMTDMGLINVFNSVGMSALGTNSAFVSQFVQKFCLEFDEDGTTAAVTTQASTDPTEFVSFSGPVVFNRPFVYFIWEKSTGAILLAGTVMDPTK